MSVANHRKPFRPVRAGTQLLQQQTAEAGTLGLVLTSDGIDRWLLTCYHVLARKNLTLVATDVVLQPDALNGAIASLSGAKIDQGLDCMAAQLTVPASNEILGLGPVSPARLPVRGMRVMKSGWKTGVTEGRIQQVSGDDVIIELLPDFPSSYQLGAGGDSGAVWVEAGTNAPVALHTSESAVGTHLAFASSFPAVLAALGLQQV